MVLSACPIDKPLSFIVALSQNFQRSFGGRCCIPGSLSFVSDRCCYCRCRRDPSPYKDSISTMAQLMVPMAAAISISPYCSCSVDVNPCLPLSSLPFFVHRAALDSNRPPGRLIYFIHP